MLSHSPIHHEAATGTQYICREDSFRSFFLCWSLVNVHTRAEYRPPKQYMYVYQSMCLLSAYFDTPKRYDVPPPAPPLLHPPSAALQKYACLTLSRDRAVPCVPYVAVSSQHTVYVLHHDEEHDGGGKSGSWFRVLPSTFPFCCTGIHHFQ